MDRDPLSREAEFEGGEGMSHRSGWFQVDTTAEIWRWRFSTAALAKYRLSKIIECDRAAVPCGRWVRIERPIRIPKLDGWLGIFPATRAPLWRTYRPVKPRYRYEVRR